jgi:hypothetical protein
MDWGHLNKVDSQFLFGCHKDCIIFGFFQIQCETAAEFCLMIPFYLFIQYIWWSKIPEILY